MGCGKSKPRTATGLQVRLAQASKTPKELFLKVLTIGDSGMKHFA
jgi:hypothetical protein